MHQVPCPIIFCVALQRQLPDRPACYFPIKELFYIKKDCPPLRRQSLYYFCLAMYQEISYLPCSIRAMRSRSAISV